MEALLAIALILLTAALLSTLANAVMGRFGIKPADQEARSRGFGDVLQKLQNWSNNRRS